MPQKGWATLAIEQSDCSDLEAGAEIKSGPEVDVTHWRSQDMDCGGGKRISVSAVVDASVVGIGDGMKVKRNGKKRPAGKQNAGGTKGR